VLSIRIEMLVVSSETASSCVVAFWETRWIEHNGEEFNSRTNSYNMRARWYDPSSARWDRLDPFSGSLQDPFSFNKYGFVHGDPIQGTDPSGLNLFLAGLGTAIHREISQQYYITHAANVVTYGTQIPGVAGAILPDIMDYTLGQIGEIKPLSAYGFATGELQVRAATAIASGLTFTYRGVPIGLPLPIPHAGPQIPWIASTWQPGFRVVWPARQNPAYFAFVAVTVGNVNGVIYYHRIRLPNSALTGMVAAYAIEQFAIRVAGPLLEEIANGLRHGFDETTELIWRYRMEAILLAAVVGGAYMYGGAIVAKVNALRLSLQTGMPAYAFA
jgi:RHS repeat-associated protein